MYPFNLTEKAPSSPGLEEVPSTNDNKFMNAFISIFPKANNADVDSRAEPELN